MNLYGEKLCDECRYVKRVVELGPIVIEGDSENDNRWYAWICEDCLRAGLALFSGPVPSASEKPTVRHIRRSR